MLEIIITRLGLRFSARATRENTQTMKMVAAKPIAEMIQSPKGTFRTPTLVLDPFSNKVWVKTT